GELGALRKKTVAGMDRLGPARLSSVENRRLVEVAVLGRRWPNSDRLIGFADKRQPLIGIREYRHGGQAHSFCNPVDSAGGLPSVCDQEFPKHGGGVESRATWPAHAPKNKQDPAPALPTLTGKTRARHEDSFCLRPALRGMPPKGRHR